MAVPAHDERDFAFAEKFGLPIVQVVAPAVGRGRARARSYVSHSDDEVIVNSGRVHGPLLARGEEGDRRVARGARPRPRRGQLPAARLAALAPALLGLPDPDDPLRGLRARAGARGGAAGAPAGDRRLPAEGALAARRGRGLGERRAARRAAGRRGARPTRWTPSSTRPGTSCATPTRTTTRRRSTASSSTTGCRSTSTSAGSSTRSCT